MFSIYVHRSFGIGVDAFELNPEAVKKDVNSNPNRPDKKAENSHENMRWWLEQNIPGSRALKLSTADVLEAHDFFVLQVSRGFPVLCSVTHAHNKTGHIILVVGYENECPNASSIDFSLVAHDPYGAYDPSLRSTLYGKLRWTGGRSLLSGAESGPGSFVRLPITAASRQYRAAHSYGKWLLSSITVD
jgi:hypothetical protein